MAARLDHTNTASRASVPPHGADSRAQRPLDILLVDDDDAMRMSLAYPLGDAGHRVLEASDGADALRLIDRQLFDVAICDVRLPMVDGLSLFRRLRQQSPKTDVILMTAHAVVPDAIAALREGVYDYITKPFDSEEFVLRVIGRLAERHALRHELERARAELAQREPVVTIVGHSPPMLRLLERVEMIAQSDANVLITGESGTGKELVARTVHTKSPRCGKPFVAVNCAAFPDTLLDAELFGHERGAFTGAIKRRVGRFKAADGGTILLDEIAEIPLPLQVKLLRVHQEGAVDPLGTNTSVPIDVRVIAATHQNLKALISEGRFREDLFYRLNVLDVNIPPLRERKEDLPLLLEYFLTRLSPSSAGASGLTPRAWQALNEYAFPGNVREFAHAVERALVFANGGEIDLEHLPVDIVDAVGGGASSGSQSEDSVDIANPSVRFLKIASKEFERDYLLRALEEASGQRGRAAALLGISRKSLWQKLREHHISDDAFRD